MVVCGYRICFDSLCKVCCLFVVLRWEGLVVVGLGVGGGVVCFGVSVFFWKILGVGGVGIFLIFGIIRCVFSCIGWVGVGVGRCFVSKMRCSMVEIVSVR